MTALALDTNVLVYAEGLVRQPDDDAKVVRSRAVLRQLITARVRPVAPIQVLAELHQVLMRHGGLTPASASHAIGAWRDRTDVVSTDGDVFAGALSLTRDHGLQVFDAIVLAGAAEASCEALLSEDVHDGFVWRGVQVINPFQAAGEARLGRILAR